MWILQQAFLQGYVRQLAIYIYIISMGVCEKKKVQNQVQKKCMHEEQTKIATFKRSKATANITTNKLKANKEQTISSKQKQFNHPRLEGHTAVEGINILSTRR